MALALFIPNYSHIFPLCFFCTFIYLWDSDGCGGRLVSEIATAVLDLPNPPGDK